MKRLNKTALCLALLVAALGCAQPAAASYALLAQETLGLEAVMESLPVCGDWRFMPDEEGGAQLVQYLGDETTVSVPAEVTDAEGNRYPVTAVGVFAFYGAQAAVEVSAPEGVELPEAFCLTAEDLNASDGADAAQRLLERLETLRENLQDNLQQVPSAAPKFNGVG